MRQALGITWLLVTLAGAGCASGEEQAPSDAGSEVDADNNACRPPRLVCHDLCVDPASSHDHCGMCDQACAAEQVCQSGECRCPDGGFLCGSDCVDLSADDAHCGDCTTDCKGDESCQSGVCGSVCAAPARLCGGVCVDVRSNDDYCGDCDTACAPDQTCANSQCVCAPPRTDCHGACVETDTNTDHCGDCDHACPGGAVCRAGECACPPGRELCGEQCVDTQRNPAFCGNCDTSCGVGLCVGGECASDCPDGETVCDDACVDTLTDAGYCGDCDTSCRTDQDCAGGFCVCPDGFAECDGRCVDTDTSETYCGDCVTECAPGEICAGGHCGCDDGLERCGAVCVDTQTSGRHCGGCNHTCGALEVCEAGDCVCVEGLERCDAACVQVGVDAAHCLGCNQPCDGAESCQAGECVADCADGLEVCDGACVDVQTDAAHCGSCEGACEPWEQCHGGSCTCVDDFWEFESPPSDGSLSQNVVLPVGTLGDSPHLRNLRLCGENADWYSFYVPSEGASLEIYLDADCLDTILPRMELYDEVGTFLTADEADGSGLCPALFATDLQMGWVDLKVVSTAGEGPYELFFFPGDLAEVEPNEDPDTATGPLMADVDVAAELDDSGVDLDTFGVFNVRPARVTLQTSDGAGSCAVDTVMFVTDDLGGAVGDDDDGGPGLCSRLELDLPVGFFYVYVIGYDLEDIGAYELSVRYAYEVESEPNQGASFEGPFTVSFGAEGVIFPAFDRDEYRIQLSAPASLRAWTDGVGWGCTLDSVLELSSESAGTLLGVDDDFDEGDDLANLRGLGYCSFIDPDSTDPDTTFAADLPAGVYTLTVTAFSDRVGPYNLSVELLP